MNEKDERIEELGKRMINHIEAYNQQKSKILEVIDNFWEQGKKIRVDITKTGKNTSKGVCIREFSYEQWEELRKVMGK
ncbi:MAG: hypothetical protein WC735_04980 [Candidatus Paceibacterota bacterium]|jgi:hypothetical protein